VDEAIRELRKLGHTLEEETDLKRFEEALLNRHKTSKPGRALEAKLWLEIGRFILDSCASTILILPLPATGRNSYNALDIATIWGDTTLVEHILETIDGATTDDAQRAEYVVGAKGGKTPLFHAIEESNLEAVKVLLRYAPARAKLVSHAYVHNLGTDYPLHSLIRNVASDPNNAQQSIETVCQIMMEIVAVDPSIALCSSNGNDGAPLKLVKSLQGRSPVLHRLGSELQRLAFRHLYKNISDLKSALSVDPSTSSMWCFCAC
jgi:hypothetical protein